jgi:putative transposase
MNPVAAGMVERPEEYPWSSARAHLEGKDDGITQVTALLEIVGNWGDLFSLSSAQEVDLLHRHERTGRPMGAEVFVEGLEKRMGRVLRPQKPGPKKS